jgi:fatty acid desaturase
MSASTLNDRAIGSSLTVRDARATRWLPQLHYSHWDALLVSLALVHGCALLSWPSIPLIALGIWWNSNTIAHYFIHLPFFKQPTCNHCFSAYQTLLLGVPQRLWRDRHMAHHADVRWRFRWSKQLMFESSLVLALWTALFVLAPSFFLTVYVSGYVLGLSLCFLQGYYEHARGTTSHYSRLYNTLFFNDGYHVEHHAHPRAHWRELPNEFATRAQRSRWPAALRWIEAINLEMLERVVLRSKWLQRFVLSRHRRAFKELLGPDEQRDFKSMGIVGGGLFPRTALVLRDLLPRCALTVIEENPEHIVIAKRWFDGGVEFVEARYGGAFEREFDAVVIPLAFHGRRSDFCVGPAPRTLFVHDWFWRRGKRTRVISWLLLKRLNRFDA